MAVRRAYARAGFGPDTVTYFEGHGTGTAVGDATELQTLTRARRMASSTAPPAVIGSIKANIGHTKAAAGIAGLIKATMAVHSQIMPPTTGCAEPHVELTRPDAALRVLSTGECWPLDRPLRAGVSSMGFGGINAHVVLEGVAAERRSALGWRERALLASSQDAEVFLVAGRDRSTLQQHVGHLSSFAARLSRAELTDLAAELARRLEPHSCWRGAIVATTPAELAGALETMADWLDRGVTARFDGRAGTFLGSGSRPPRIGFLFPGQAAPARLNGGALRRRFSMVDNLYDRVRLPTNTDGRPTNVAQPAIATASLAGLRILDALGITAALAVGHSLGEITAYAWGGALDEEALLRVARARGEAMAAIVGPTGAMASIGAGVPEVEELLQTTPAVIAGINAPRQTVIAGESSMVETIVDRAHARNLRAAILPVSHAFHSPLVAQAAPELRRLLTGEEVRPLERMVVSTITGGRIGPDDDLRLLLYRQVTEPVRFMDAVQLAAREIDLLIEVGPGQILTALVATFLDTPVIATDAGGPRLRGTLAAVGAAFALGSPLRQDALVTDRFTRPFDLDWRPRFFTNPCELAPVPETAALATRCEPPVPPEAVTAEPPLESSPLELVRRLVAERAELPVPAVEDGSKLLSDLHLNSITVGEIVVAAAERLDLPPPVAPTDFADATVEAVAQALAEWAQQEPESAAVRSPQLPPGIDSWVRPFQIELVERPRPPRQPDPPPGHWTVFACPDDSDAAALAHALPGWGNGAIVCLPEAPDERHVGLLLNAAHTVLYRSEPAMFILVQHGGGASSFARTLHLEAPWLTVCVVDTPPADPQVAEWVLAEAQAASGYSEVHYDLRGRRRQPVLRLLPVPVEAAPVLGLEDVLLVTGGGKGIAAECAFALARETGVRLALLGRSDPDTDRELKVNLDRFAAAGITPQYAAADVTDPGALSRAVKTLTDEVGPITALLHAAGTNVPHLINGLDETTAQETLAPKVQGLRNLLAALDTGSLRLLVTFGSIIARSGLPGEADYALANEWLATLTERFQEAHPSCRCLAIEWSVWSGVGMGERLGRVDSLVRRGIDPITADIGVATFCALVHRRWPTASLIMTSRFPDAPTLEMERPELPFLRFLDQSRVFYPGIELIVDAELSAETDPYLDDHAFQGQKLLPAVMGLEAMAQAAMAVTGRDHPPGFEDVRFERPVVVPDGGALAVRLAALVREPDRVEVALRTDRTGFQADHFRALCRFDASGVEPAIHAPAGSSPPSAAATVELDPERDLYDGLLFHAGRFRRLTRYYHLRATECLAEIAPAADVEWFGRYAPPDLVLGDPAARDTAIHAIQACIPHATLLPVGIERLAPLCGPVSGPLLVHARERHQDGSTFLYDVTVIDTAGKIREVWEGLRLQVAGHRTPSTPWPGALIAPYIERRVRDLIPGAEVMAAVAHGPRTNRRAQSDALIERLFRTTVPISRRPDGKPEVDAGRHSSVSIAHTGLLSLSVAGGAPVACDIEPVEPRPASRWRALLGAEGFSLAQLIAEETGEDLAIAATRVWGVRECLKKEGAMANAPLRLVSREADGVMQLASGPVTIVSLVILMRESETPLAVAILVDTSAESPRTVRRRGA